MNALTPIAQPRLNEAGPRIRSSCGRASLPGVTKEAERYTIFSPRAQSAFLENLQLNGNVRLACRAARVSPQTAYRARRASPVFAALWDAALLAARTHAEEVLADRALNGIEEAVFYHGEEVATRRRYSDRLLLAHLARLDRLAEREDIAANLAVLDEAIAVLAKGEELGEELLAQPPEKHPMDPVPSVPSSRNSPPSSSAALGQTGTPSSSAALGQTGTPSSSAELGQTGTPSSSAELGQTGTPSSSAALGQKKCPECGGNCEDPDADLTEDDCMWLGNRLAAMDCARPEGAKPPHELARNHPYIGAEDIEYIQLDAFEAGEEEWWLVMPAAAEWAEIVAAHD